MEQLSAPSIGPMASRVSAFSGALKRKAIAVDEVLEGEHPAVAENTQSAAERVSVWIGAPVEEFKCVYSLGSRGFHSDCEGGAQFESPFMGAPAWLFDSDLELGEAAFYFRCGKTGFLATSSYACDTSSNECLRRLAREMGLSTFECADETSRKFFRLNGFSLHRTFATLVALRPSTFSLLEPWTCCDNHRTCSRLASLQSVPGRPIWIKDLLYDPGTFSKCLSFSDMPMGSDYKAFMDKE